MYRRNSRWLTILLVVGASLSCVCAPVGADEVGSYLQRHGLKQLLAVHLEQQLKEAKGELRTDLVRQLGKRPVPSLIDRRRAFYLSPRVILQVRRPAEGVIDSSHRFRGGRIRARH